MSKVPEVSIVIGSVQYSKCWKKISIIKSMNSICGSINLESIDFFTGKRELDPYQAWVGGSREEFNSDFKNYTGFEALSVGGGYELRIDRQLNGKGYLDEINIDYDQEGTSVELNGRDVTCDLADCHHAQEYSYLSGTLDGFISILCIPFNILVSVDKEVAKGVDKFKKRTIEIGQPLLEVIMKECLNVGVIPLSYGDGKLYLTRGTKTRRAGVVIQDSLIQKGRIVQSNTERFSDYITKGHGVATSKKNNLSDYTKPDGKYEDKGVNRYRPFIILPETDVSIQECEDRSRFEANIRAGQSRAIEYVIQGWYQPGTIELWDINTLVKVRDPKIGVNDEKLISEVEFIRDPNEGDMTRLTLVHKDTYSLNEATELMKSGFDINTARGTLRGA